MLRRKIVVAPKMLENTSSQTECNVNQLSAHVIELLQNVELYAQRWAVLHAKRNEVEE